MPALAKLRSQLQNSMQMLRLRLSGVDALPQLALLGIIVGLLSGAVILAFRLLVELIQEQFLPGGNAENFEDLKLLTRIFLPLLGALLIGIWLHRTHSESRQVGVVHVMERLAYHQGHLPLKNAVVQFFGIVGCVVTGQSIGREGPAVHLGAASGSLLGQYLHLPNNSIRTLVACGVAAAIAASFNTPLAGVVFAMEVVMMEYTLTGFAPVIAAAVSATTLTRAVFGDAPAFAIPPLGLSSLVELPFVLLMGLVIGILAAMFIGLLKRFSTLFTEHPLWLRCTLGGTIVGVCGAVVPQVMGIGYDTVNGALLGQMGIMLMVAVVVFKIVATAACLGLGLPGGLIGPTLVIGATAGGTMGLLAAQWFPEQISNPAFFALIGMGTMMGATLQAPLAALIAMLELTANPNIILPGMLALITAGLVSKELLGKDSVFLELMRARGLDYRHDPVMQALRRVGVASVMNRKVVALDSPCSKARAEKELSLQPRWLLYRHADKPPAILPAADLARYLTENPGAEEIDLAEIPAQRLSSTPISIQATLQEALDNAEKSGSEAVHVVQYSAPGIQRVAGILTRQDIHNSYRYSDSKT